MMLKHLVLALPLAFPLLAFSAVTPASLFTDHMVLQQGVKTPVWGTADAGEKISVSFGEQKLSAVADKNGKWRVDLASMNVSAEGRDLVIAGTNTHTLHDVLVGEVWLCSGQSNMDFTVVDTPKFRFAGVANKEAEVAAANYPTIRMFSGQWTKAYTPQTTIQGEWKICNPQNVPEFSAIGYFFARDLQKELKVPVGIVTMTFGASCAEAWVRREALEADPKLKPMLQEFDASVQKYRANPTGKDPVQDQHQPTVMYNGMIAPMLPYGIKGVLWYQGESIIGTRRDVFALTNETLIRDWRKLFENENMPFYFCQLASQDKPSNSPETRELQAQALSVPNVFMAVTTDIGERTNVHPKNKQDVGDRLTKIALANAYGKSIEYSGPVLTGSKVEGNAIRVSFSHAKELVAKGGGLKGFTIAGADGKFVPATAKIDGATVLVSSAEVASPTVVRYAWVSWANEANLYNEAGLPAAQFRTDNIPPAAH